MAQNIRVLKVISIVQLMMAVIFFTLGMFDRFQVRYIYTSFLCTPCWIAALVLLIGIIGLVLSNTARRPFPSLIIALRSVSMACVAVSAITVYQYYLAVTSLVGNNYIKATNYQLNFPYFVDKDITIKYTEEEEIMLIIFSLVIIFSIVEIMLAFASARSGDTGTAYLPVRRNQVGQSNRPTAEAGQIPLRPPAYIATKPKVAIPGSGNM